MNALVDRVNLVDAGIRISLKLPICGTEDRQSANATTLIIMRVFPMQIRRRGFEMRLVIQGSRAPAPLTDLALIKAVARGHLWADGLLTGRVDSVAVIAEREGVLPNYVRRLTRLAFLAPRTVEAIAAGHQPPELTAKALTERFELPLLWSEQERAVRINESAHARDFCISSPVAAPFRFRSKRSRQICQQRLWPRITHHLPESGFLRSHRMLYHDLLAIVGAAG